MIATQVTPGSPPTITALWQTATGSGGSPIVAGGLVWTIDHNNGNLYGLSPSTGDGLPDLRLGAVANHFPTPSVADGLLLAASSNKVHAFDGPAGLPPPPPAPPASSDLIHVDAAAPGGALTDFVPDHANGRVWNAYDVSADAGGPAVTGTPGAVVAGLLHVYVRAANGDLVEYVDNGAGGAPWNAYDLTAGGRAAPRRSATTPTPSTTPTTA